MGFWPDFPQVENLIGAFSLGFGGFFIWDLSRSWNTPIVGWTGLFLYPTFPLLVSTLDSETLLYLALCLASFAFYALQRYMWTVIFVAFVVLTRTVAVLVPIILMVDYLWYQWKSGEKVKRLPWCAVILFLCIITPLYLFSWIYFGTPLPARLPTKQSQGIMPSVNDLPS